MGQRIGHDADAGDFIGQRQIDAGIDVGSRQRGHKQGVVDHAGDVVVVLW